VLRIVVRRSFNQILDVRSRLGFFLAKTSTFAFRAFAEDKAPNGQEDLVCSADMN
jgi:hypothetical protein